jgi:serine phosphatase RsbU (regulator of sigma subunit)
LCNLNENLERKVAARTAELETINIRLSESLALVRQDEEAGRMIQFNLLPEDSKTIGPYEFSRYLAPSLCVSGDFVSYFEIDADHIGFYIADVSGHGVSSAFITVLLYSMVHNCLENYAAEKDPTILDPKRMLGKLNDELYQQGAGKYITIFYGVLDQRDNTLTFANGGQFPLPMIRSRNRVERVMTTGPAVGLFDISTYENGKLRLPDEFALFAFSDGVLEILEPESVEGKLSLLQSILGSPGQDIEGVVKQIGLDHMSSLPDDITILLVRRKEDGAGR